MKTTKRTVDQIRREIDSLKFRLCTDFDASGRAMANRLEVVENELREALTKEPRAGNEVTA